MADNCSAGGCLVSARADALEKEFDRCRDSSSTAHKQMFDRIGALEQGGTALRAKLDGIDEKLDELAAAVKALTDKPAKRWESLVGCALSALAGAFAAWIAAGMPGLR